jgi:hypothetical protein
MVVAFLAIWAGATLACAIIGRYVAEQKGRSGAEGLWLGFLLGPLGVLVAALMPTVEAPRPGRRPAPPVRRAAGGWQPPKEDDPAEDEAFGYLSEGRRIRKPPAGV